MGAESRRFRTFRAFVQGPTMALWYDCAALATAVHREQAQRRPRQAGKPHTKRPPTNGDILHRALAALRRSLMERARQLDIPGVAICDAERIRRDLPRESKKRRADAAIREGIDGPAMLARMVAEGRVGPGEAAERRELNRQRRAMLAAKKKAAKAARQQKRKAADQAGAGHRFGVDIPDDWGRAQAPED